LVGSDALVVFEARLSLLLPEQFAGPEVMRQVIRRDVPQKKCPPPWVHGVTLCVHSEKVAKWVIQEGVPTL
jgi:hypothetical protein